ncbi:MAG: hypothetical protein OXR73_25655 [Myxococcales bacterium]|nr:hypothetical protein [Myxococcales bacterium]
MTTHSLTASMTALLLLSACGDQASTAYQGEPLLRFDGRVQLLQGTADRALIPALAFQAPHGYWSVMDVEVAGEFPASFTLSVLDPPPDNARLSFSDLWPESPDFAAAAITAADENHPAGFQRANNKGTQSACAGLPADCTRVRRDFCYTGDGDPQWSDYRGDGLPFVDCYSEVRDCPLTFEHGRDADYDQCELVESQGDPTLASGADSEFAGFSQGHTVVYLYGPAPEGSMVAQLFNAPHGLPSGYHLLERRPRTAQEQEEAWACHDEAEELAYERLVAELPEANCEANPPALGSSFTVTCDADHENFEEESRLLRKHLTAATAELKCPSPGKGGLFPVDLSGEITIEIGETLEGLPGDVSAR